MNEIDAHADRNDTKASGVNLKAVAEKPRMIHILTILGIICILGFFAWLLFGLILRLNTAENLFLDSDRITYNEIVYVDVSRAIETRTRTVGLGANKHTENYDVAVYSCSYNNAVDKFITENLTSDYSGRTPATYVNGVVSWNGKELTYEQLSAQNFPNYDEDRAYSPQKAGANAIHNAMLSEYDKWNFLAWLLPISGFLCLLARFILQHKISNRRQ